MAYASHRLEHQAAAKYPALGERLQPADAQALADLICEATGVGRVEVIGNLKTRRRAIAWYENDTLRIRHIGNTVQAKVLLHELAHHLVANHYWGPHPYWGDQVSLTGFRGRQPTWHGREFAGVVWALYEQWAGAQMDKPADYHKGAYRQYSDMLA